MEHYETDVKRLAEIVKTNTADSWEQQLNQAKVPAARVRSVKEAASHPHLTKRNVFQDLNVEGKDIRFPNAAFSFESGGPEIRNAPPNFAQHTREIMDELGYTQSEVNGLLEGAIISTHQEQA